MKRVRLSLIVIMLVIILLLLGFGVYAFVAGNSGITNNVMFNSGDENVFVKIDADYNGPTLSTAGAQVQYPTYTLGRDMGPAYRDEPVDIPSWELGITNFTTTQTVIKLTFVFENLNNVNGLNVSVGNIAYDVEQKFTTSYAVTNSKDAIDSQTPTLLYSTENTAVMPVQYAAPGETLCIRLIFAVALFDKDFSFANITFNSVILSE